MSLVVGISMPLTSVSEFSNRYKLNITLDGGVAQLGEHLPCKQGVRGSNPLISTLVCKLNENESKTKLEFSWDQIGVLRERKRT